MSRRFEGTAIIDRPIEQVFAYLADGTHDPEFSPRVQEIRKTPDGPTAVGTVFASTVKDAGMKTGREFAIVELQEPTRIRWSERTKNAITVPIGGYDLAPEGDGTRVTIFNELEGHGFGKLIVGFAHKAAVKDAPTFAHRIKQAIEAS
jgi:carbon monoxide dehydrogenase subunit G